MIPVGLLVTVPAPVPCSNTVSAKFTAVNDALAVCEVDITSVQVPVSEQSPPQNEKTEPAAGVAVSVTSDPLEKLVVQVPPVTTPLVMEQFIPDGLLVTVPVPVPNPPDGAIAETVIGNVPVPLLNVAVTVVAADRVTVQVFAVPEHPPPLHPANTDPGFGVSAKTICVPLGKLDVHVPVTTPVSSLQTKFEALQLTAPYAVPFNATVTVSFVVVLKVAVTDSAAFIVSWHVPVPPQAPLQPANVEPDPGVGVSVTTVPLLKFAVHVLGQEIPLGELVTVPVPVPAVETVSGKVEILNVAVTDSADVIVTTQLPVPLQAPLQPANTDPLVGTSVSVTTVPLAKFAVQVCVQLIPAGLLVTVPVPVPAAM